MSGPTSNPSILERARRNCLADPKKEIIADAARRWTWADLWSYAEAVADLLAVRDFGPIVPILVGRNVESAGVMLGCMIAGRPFANVSPNQPLARIVKCLAKVGSRNFVNATGKPTFSAFDDGAERYRAAVEVPLSPGESGPVARSHTSREANQIPADRLLYVLFTSGSTGTPKGVLLSESNIKNTLEWSLEYTAWRPTDVIGLATNFYFDISLFDFFSTLYFDVPLFILSDPADAEATVREVSERRVTSLFATPAFFSQFVRSGLHKRLVGLRQIFSGGDFFPPAHLLDWKRTLPALRLFNVWGPTETSIVNTMHLVTAEDEARLGDNLSPPVGLATERMPFVLLQEGDRPVTEPGVVGEIAMLGPCVSQGYLNETSSAGENFFQWDGRRAYRTGDLGSFDANGRLLISGRKGAYVKVNGYRVELGEVESSAAKVPGVFHASACVVDVADGVRELWLAVEPKDVPVEIGAVKSHCRTELPAYMVPKRIFALPVFPKNHNGKIDRQAIKELMLTAANR